MVIMGIIIPYGPVISQFFCSVIISLDDPFFNRPKMVLFRHLTRYLPQNGRLSNHLCSYNWPFLDAHLSLTVVEEVGYSSHFRQLLTHQYCIINCIPTQ